MASYLQNILELRRQRLTLHRFTHITSDKEHLFIPLILLVPLFQASKVERVRPLGGVRERGSLCGGVGGTRGHGGGGGAGRQAGQGGRRGQVGLSLSVCSAVGCGAGLALGLQAAAAAALQGRAGGFGGSCQRRGGAAGQGGGPEAVTQDACTHQELPGSIGRRRRSAGAWGAQVVRGKAPPRGDIVDPQIWPVEGLRPGLEAEHPLPLLQIPSLVDGRHDGF